MKQLETGATSALYEIDLTAPILASFEHQTPLRAIIRAEPDLVDQSDTEADMGFAYDSSIGYTVIGTKAETDAVFESLLSFMKTTLADEDFITDDLAPEAANNLFQFQFEGQDLFGVMVGGYSENMPDKVDEIIKESGLTAILIGAWADDLDVFGALFLEGQESFVIATTREGESVDDLRTKLEAFKEDDET